jgi:hypothetical protein
VSGSFDMSDYSTVAERLAAGFDRYPDCRFQSEVEDVRNAAGELIGWKCRVAFFRTPDDQVPIIAHAVEPYPGKTSFTKDSEAMNAETSAIGRALILAGFPSKKIASADEVRNRSGLGEPQPNGSQHSPSSEASPKPELVTPPEDAKPSDYVVHFGKNRGVLLGSLTAAQLSWYATKWEVQDTPSDYDRRLKAAAVSLHAGDDSPLVAALSAHDQDLPF